MKQSIGIVGGGISGLSAAYFALKKGYAVELFERTDQLGGFAASFDFGGLQIERYYHFICGGDTDLFSFAEELGIRDQICFRPTKTAFFYNGHFYPFSSAFDLLKFSPISPFSRLRFGLNAWYSKSRKKWIHIDHLTAVEWLERTIGKQAYTVIWHPLLNLKFGEDYDRISAPWLWHRIHRVASSRRGIFSKEKMGFFKGGSSTLINAVKNKIIQMGGQIHLNAEVDAIAKNKSRFRFSIRQKESQEFEKVILAVPLPVSAEFIAPLDKIYASQLSAIKFIGILCGIFRLKKSISDVFWLNISDPRTPSNGLIEYTNLNPLEKDNIFYIPFYLPHGDSRFKQDNAALKKDFFQTLKLIKPDLTESDLLDFSISRSPNAQAICEAGFKDRIPEQKIPLGPLFILDSTQLYPSDRAISALIGLAGRCIDKYF